MSQVDKVIDGGNWTPATGTEKTICPECGVTSVSYPARRFRETIMEHHDYMPTTFVIRLKPGTPTTYIVPVALEPIARCIRSLDRGAGFLYGFDVALRGDDFVQRTLDEDDRIEEWHTVVLFAPDETVVESAVVCKSHVHFRQYMKESR